MTLERIRGDQFSSNRCPPPARQIFFEIRDPKSQIRNSLKEHRVSVRIRMKMTGRKHRPFFRICVIDRQKARDGLPIEELGTYDPMVKTKSERVKVNMERIDYWISVGATPSDRVATLLKKIKNNDF